MPSRKSLDRRSPEINDPQVLKISLLRASYLVYFETRDQPAQSNRIDLMVTGVAGLPSPPPGLLAEPLKTRRLPSDDLAAVHRRRILPTVVTQTPQRVLHRRLLAPVLRGGEAQPPAAMLAAVRTRGWPRSPADASGQVLPMLRRARNHPQDCG